MSRIIKFNGYIVDEEDNSRAVSLLHTVENHPDSRHVHLQYSKLFKMSTEDVKSLEKNCDLAHLEDYFPQLNSFKEYSRELPKKGEIWVHFKEGNEVEIIDLAKHSENPSSILVVYTCPQGVYARPLNIFMSEVDRVKYPEAKQKYRFERKATN